MNQPVVLNVKMIDEASQVAQSSSEKIKDSFGAAFLEVSEKSKDFSEEFKRQEEEKIAAVKEKLDEQGKAFTEFLNSITLEFNAFNSQIRLDTFSTIEQIGQFPLAMRAGYLDFVNETGTSLNIVRNLTKATAVDSRKFFSDLFFSQYKNDVNSLGALWANFTNSMKDRFVRALSDMAANLATSGLVSLLQGGLNILGFSKGGVIPNIPGGDEAFFLGRSKEGILTPEAVAKIGGESGLKALNLPGAPGSSFIGPPTQAQHLVNQGISFAQGAGAAFLGNQLAGSLLRGGVGTDAGSGVGGAVGFSVGGPVGGPVGAGIGSFFGGAFGSLFGPERLNRSELEAGSVFKSIRQSVDSFDTAIALTALRVGSGTGFDSLGDGIRVKGGVGHIPGDASAFIRKSFLGGLSNLVSDPSFGTDRVAKALLEAGFGDGPRAAFTEGLAEGLLIHRDFPSLLSVLGKLNIPSFRDGLDFVPFDNFPAFLHRGERVLTEAENFKFSSPAVDPAYLAGIKALQEEDLRYKREIKEILLRQERAMENMKIEVKVVTPDEDEQAEYTLKVLDRRIRDRQFTIDVAAITGLKSSARL